MKALILAAGRGTRLQSVHHDHPKCLIQFNHSRRTILDQQIESLLAAGVSQIGIVVGYEKDQIIRHVESVYRSHMRQFEFIENPRFAETNNIYSLWTARDWLRGDGFVVLNADVVFYSGLLIPLMRSTTPVTMIVDPDWRDETMKVIIRDYRVVSMSKRISREDFSGTYIGITAFAASVHARFFRKVEALIDSGRHNEFFNSAVQELADEGMHVGFSPTVGLPWAEIDDPGDLAFARIYIFPKLQRLEAA